MRDFGAQIKKKIELGTLEDYDDQLHRELITRGDTEIMKKWLEQEAIFTPKHVKPRNVRVVIC